MDTSEQRIEMRIKAIPDLGNGVVIGSDFRSNKHLFFSCEDYDVWIDYKGDWYVFRDDIPTVEDMGRVCQLERQDQLQEMVIEHCTNIEEPWAHKEWNMIKKFCEFVGELIGWGDASMEQLWLAFVIKELYHKVWIKEVRTYVLC